MAALRESGGVWSAACRVASPHSTNENHPPCYSSFKNLARRDPELGAAVEEILTQCRDDVEAEIHRRGQVGYEDNVYQKGEQVFNRDGTPATVKRFSDNLLLARARALMPEKYNEKKQVQHSGTIAHSAGHLQITSQDLIALNSEQRTALTGILKTIQGARREDDAVPALTYEPAEVLDADFEEVDDGDTMAVLNRMEADE